MGKIIWVGKSRAIGKKLESEDPVNRIMSSGSIKLNGKIVRGYAVSDFSKRGKKPEKRDSGLGLFNRGGLFG